MVVPAWASKRVSEAVSVGFGGSNEYYLSVLDRECAPLQEIRELLQNCIDELASSNIKEGRIEMVGVEFGGTPKFAMVDNGNSMSPQKLPALVGEFGGTLRKRGIYDNFAIGVKTAVAPRNPFGVIYVCKVPNEEPHAAVIMNVNNDFKVVPLDWTAYAKQCSTPLPELIKKNGHGTMVILLGKSADDNTWKPGGASEHWAASYISKKYFSFPKNIEIYSVTSKSFEQGRRGHVGVNCQSNLIKKYGIAQGTVEMRESPLSGRVHWAIIESRSKRQKIGGEQPKSHGCSWDLVGNFSIRNGSEIYGYYDGAEGAMKKRRYGIIGAGASDPREVVLHIEIDNLHARMSREGLKGPDGDIDLYCFAQEFQKKLRTHAKELFEYLENGAAQRRERNAQTRDDRIADKLNDVLQYMNSQNMDLQFRFVTTKTGGQELAAVRKQDIPTGDDGGDEVEEEHKKKTYSKKNKVLKLRGKPSNRGRYKARMFEPPWEEFTPHVDEVNTVFIELHYNGVQDVFHYNPNYPPFAKLVDKLAKKFEGSKSRTEVEDSAITALRYKFVEIYALAKADVAEAKHRSVTLPLGDVLTSKYMTDTFRHSQSTISKEAETKCKTGRLSPLDFGEVSGEGEEVA